MGDQQAHDHIGAAARRVVSERLRVFFSELREALDPDTEDFFDRVMRQEEKRPQHSVR